jgi:hypothetical protein
VTTGTGGVGVGVAGDDFRQPDAPTSVARSNETVKMKM